MRFNSTVALTFTLLAMMLGSGVFSGFWSYTLGHEALKGVTQPDVSPTKKLAGDSQIEGARNQLIILDENDILNQVKTYIKNGGKNPNDEDDNFLDSDESTLEVQTNNTDTEKVKLPIKTADEGVILEIVDISQKGGSLLLDVNLKNDGVRAVRFLYSFLDVKDNQGRSLSAITDGLPGEVPANNVSYSGTIKIPTALLENSKQLSLTLTDYPDQKLELKLSGIPVTK